MRLSHLAILYGRYCNLRCKYCAEYNPYFTKQQRKKGNCDQTISDIQKIASACERIGTLNISGGEAFLNKGIDELLTALFELKNVDNFYIVTNASYPPPSSSLNIIAQHKNARVEISGYMALGLPKEEAVNKLKQYNIPFNIRKNQVWYDIFNSDFRECTLEQLKHKYRNCRLSSKTWLYTDGYLALSCCRPNRMFFLNKFDECKNELLKISDVPIENLAKRMLQLESLEYSDICRYCDGVFSNTPQVTPALEQL